MCMTIKPTKGSTDNCIDCLIVKNSFRKEDVQYNQYCLYTNWKFKPKQHVRNFKQIGYIMIFHKLRNFYLKGFYCLFSNPPNTIFKHPTTILWCYNTQLYHKTDPENFPPFYSYISNSAYFPLVQSPLLTDIAQDRNTSSGMSFFLLYLYQIPSLHYA